MDQRVLITSVFLHPGDEVDTMLRRAGCETVHAPLHGRRSAEELEGLLQGVHGVIAASDPFTAEVLAGATDLRVIARTGVGYDAIDVAAATRLGIAVCNAPGVNRQSVAEHTFALLLAHARRLGPVLQDVANGGWARPSGRELAGSTIGVVGLGAIGASVARIARAFGMRVLGHDPFLGADRAAELDVELLPLDQLVGQADWITLHLALTDETHHLIDARRLALMRPEAILVNTARGPIVDQDALMDAIRQERIGGAALDVVEHEPLEPDHPFRTSDRVLLTPHIGGSTAEARARSGVIAAQSVIDILRGSAPVTLVDAGVQLRAREEER